ncbi:two-component system, response regulator YesN [Eubacterium oxidoreducens]|uniref:Stage 0 sporulation protein A homolog n=2 Tax=Eubacterium oxidoreducens TaxID=1732 RepID=A0A1G6BRC9_EUBOX|nr:two-component system, response regulator YesN [Eubacterium oxidoreducens]
MNRILIVDDDQIMRKALRVMVGKIDGFIVCAEAMNGKQALEAYEKYKPDIIFMDLVMPTMTGVEAAEIIRKKDSDTIIYFISAYNNFELAKQAVKLKVNEYLVKPVSMKLLSDVLMNQRVEQESKIGYYLELLEEIVEQKDFKNAYHKLPGIIKEIYEKYGQNNEQLVSNFRYLGQRLLVSAQKMDGQAKEIDELFAISELHIGEPMLGEMWMFKVINHVFLKNSIRRYPVLANVFSYIDNNIHEEIGLSQIIDNCAISQGYLSRIFKDQFNVSVMEYLHMRKIHLAKGYFYLTNDSVAEVAFKLGYNESSYFSKVFKKYENMTIQQYKKSVIASN